MLENTIELAEVVRQLRAQLQLAMEAGTDEDLRFEVQDLELELQVAVTKSAGGGFEGGSEVKFRVFEAGASGKVEASIGSERVQRLKLRLRPTTGAQQATSGKVFLGGA